MHSGRDNDDGAGRGGGYGKDGRAAGVDGLVLAVAVVDDGEYFGSFIGFSIHTYFIRLGGERKRSKGHAAQLRLAKPFAIVQRCGARLSVDLLKLLVNVSSSQSSYKLNKLSSDGDLTWYEVIYKAAMKSRLAIKISIQIQLLLASKIPTYKPAANSVAYASAQQVQRNSHRNYHGFTGPLILNNRDTLHRRIQLNHI
ncbi:Hypothetical predicted protein [Octopus vulgaris]|uniref:Uncharacterized protein n=1 Tax=Octopus vulgaris TaxID=6645 RepID=A0AA36F1Q3_OCTVU|nr:Hypothetical predicted protein [Octopus vulgaris]